jgi:hypothetical protein
MWTVTRRNYHGVEKMESAFPWVGIRWVVVREGETRGICECWSAEEAEQVAAALNASDGVGISKRDACSTLGER